MPENNMFKTKQVYVDKCKGFRMCMLNTCQQVAILSNIVELSSRKAEVQIHHRSISRVTAVYNKPVKKWRIKPTTRIHSI